MLLDSKAADAPLVPGRGEFFSVSRYRAVDGELGPIRGKRDISTVEVLIVDTNSKILVLQKLTTDQVGTEREVARPRQPVETPAEDGTAPEPGAEAAAPAPASDEATSESPAAAPEATE